MAGVQRRKPGGMDSWSPLKGVHFESGVVGQDPFHPGDSGDSGEMESPGHRLDPRIGFKRVPRLVGLDLGGDIPGRQEFECRAEFPPNFSDFVGVSGGQEAGGHGWILRREPFPIQGQTGKPDLNTLRLPLSVGIPLAANMTSVADLNATVQEAGSFLQPLYNEINRYVVGQKYLVERLVIGLLANGHVLLEGVPGLAKTLSVKTLATALHTRFSRIQFTPDMLPADVVGTQIFNPQTGSFSIRRGPVFANLVLADEINRAPAKVQSALLEAMQERQVTIGDQTFPLAEPFLVLATQNPIEQEGTYTLPEAQVDRFMLKLKIGYPTRDEERLILDLMARTNGLPSASPVVEGSVILRARQVINELYVDDKVKDYIVDIVCATRDPDAYRIGVKGFIQLGASPRATIALTLAAKAHAFLRGRGYVTPQDVKSIGLDVLRHRVTLTYEAEAEEKTAEDVVQRILDELPVP